MRFKERGYLAFTLFLQVLYLLSLYYKIKIFAPIMGFILISFIPGYLILKIINNNEVDLVEAIFLSVINSIVMIFISFFLFNGLMYTLGYRNPLSFNNIFILLNLIILVLTLYLFIKKEESDFKIKDYHVSPVVVIPIIIFLIVLRGVININAAGDHTYLMVSTFLLPLLFTGYVLYIDRFNKNTIFIILFLISLSLLHGSSLLSNWITVYGSDAQVEYYFFRRSFDGCFWDSTVYDRLNSMLSITIFPTIVSRFINVEGTWVFKIIYPFYSSLIPGILFYYWETFIGKIRAYIASFLFLSCNTYYTELLGLNRQIIAELFLAGLLYTIFYSRIRKTGKQIYYILYVFGIVTSHYGLATLFLFYIIITLLYVYSDNIIFVRFNLKKFSIFNLSLFFIVMFSWYTFISESSSLYSMIGFTDYVLNSFGDIFNLASREATVLRGLGLEAASTVWNSLSRIFFYLVNLVILAGFFAWFMKKVDIRHDEENTGFIIVSMVVLSLLIIIPGLSKTMNMTRFYQILLFFIAPLFPVGSDYIANSIYKNRSKLLSLSLCILVLNMFFMFQTGFIYELVGNESYVLSLSKYRISNYTLYTHVQYMNDYNAIGAGWLYAYNDPKEGFVYGDSSIFYIIPYSMIPSYMIYGLSNTTTCLPGSKIMVSYMNTKTGNIIMRTRAGIYEWGLPEFDFYVNESKLYSNSRNEIYYEGYP